MWFFAVKTSHMGVSFASAPSSPSASNRSGFLLLLSVLISSFDFSIAFSSAFAARKTYVRREFKSSCINRYFLPDQDRACMGCLTAPFCKMRAQLKCLEYARLVVAEKVLDRRRRSNFFVPSSAPPWFPLRSRLVVIQHRPRRASINSVLQPHRTLSV